jgi:hypothetical protein
VKRGVLFLVLCLVTACGDATGGDDNGSVRFEYDGAISGDFDARGDGTFTSAEDFVTAAVERDGGTRVLSVNGSDARGATRRAISFSAPAALGTHACAAAQQDCAVSARLFVPTDTSRAAGTREFVTDSGSVTITGLDERRVLGTFTFYLRDRADPFTTASPRVRVHSGRFSVSLYSPLCGFACDR